MNLYDDTKTLRELYRAYYTMVRDDVKSVLIDANQDDSGNPVWESVAQVIRNEDETISDRLHEEADTIVTYTMDAKVILLVSENEDAAEDELGEDEARKLTVEQRAYYAYLADCRQVMGNEYTIADFDAEIFGKASA